MAKEWARSNPERVRENKVAYANSNRATIRAKAKAREAANKERYRGYGAKYRAAHAEKETVRNRLKRQIYRERNREYRKRYFDEYPWIKTLWDANRRAAERQATPRWANHFFIAEIYHLAKLREQVCGGEWHVDHIVPLRGKTVCGLHVEHNLQVIPAEINHQKSNRWWPDMP